VHERRLRFAMKIGGDYRVFLGRNTWPIAATELGVDSNAIVDRARELASAAPDAFADAAGAPGVVALHRALPSKLLDLVADRAALCLKLLESPS
jgi:serine/threonine-protein kinase HipA